MKSVWVEQVVVEKTEDKKKKNRRSNRRTKLVPSPPVDEIQVEAPKLLGNGKLFDDVSKSLTQRSLEICPQYATSTPNDTLSSLPPICANGKRNIEDNQRLQNHNSCLSDPGGKLVLKVCTEPINCQGSSESYVDGEIESHNQNEGYGQKGHFACHWSMDAVNAALERGDVFKACFRVNAHNKAEAFCRIDGVPTDVLIYGASSQNRAVEGDIVAVEIEPLPSWTKMKGSIMNDSRLAEGSKSLSECNDMASTSSKGKSKVDRPDESLIFDDLLICGEELHSQKSTLINGHSRSEPNGPSNHGQVDGLNSANPKIGELCALISSSPSKRPTGKVLAVIEKSPRREAVAGFLNVKKLAAHRELLMTDDKKNKGLEFLQLIPNDPRYPTMMVRVQGLPNCIKKRLENGDTTLETELVGARFLSWTEESFLPQARISHIFGAGFELDAQICAILFENSVCSTEFAPESIFSLPPLPWELPLEELQTRRDLRNLCIFTIDPSTAADLDDALSVERLSNFVFRVGVHIADVSYFVLPDTELDKEARIRSTSVYMLRSKLPMLPPLLSENVGSLNPGVDRLAFSIFLDINLAGEVVDRSIGRTVIRSCCKLSYEQAQGIIDGPSGSSITSGNSFPALHGQFEWLDVVNSVKDLHGLSKTLREKRFNDGALSLESRKISFLFDESRNPCDIIFGERKASNFLVEEYMLLANRTVAEVICRAFPDSALLRRHPEPNPRKLREFESFCCKHGLELDSSSSHQFHMSLQKMKEKLKDDSTLLDILLGYASRPMQLATYFSTGDFKDSEKDWGHYGLGVPLYTHFTSPLRRYPDIVVHRTLAAVIEAEEVYSRKGSETMSKYFTGIVFEKNAAKSPEGREVLLEAALKHGVPGTESLSEVATHCNDRKLASKRVKEACDKLYMWALLKSKKGLFSEGRVVNLGPRFMTVYIQKFSIERRINYEDVEGLITEWLEDTSTLVLNFYPNKRSFRKGGPGKCRPVEDVALIVSPCDLLNGTKLEPLVFPLTLRVLSTIPVALHAIGGDSGPVDIGARLYMSSYFGILKI